MKILIATRAPFLPQMIGGSQRTGDTLVRELSKRGHVVGVTSALVGADWLGWRGRVLMKLTRRHAVQDRTLGYQTYRSWDPAATAAEVVGSFKPDVVLIQAHSPGLMAKAFLDARCRVVLNLQDVEFKNHGFDLRKLGKLTTVANSAFTAEAYRDAYGYNSRIIHPLIDQVQYRVEAHGTRVTFINPDKLKGLDIAVEVARLLPSISFRFQEAWPLSKEQRASLLARLNPLANVRLVPPVNDMRDVYADTRVLLCPSQWQEGYGRIATEAQASGIPVIGSDRGGLPEAIGPGGIVLPADAPAEEWAAAIVKVWESAEVMSRLSVSARSHAARPTLVLANQIDDWEEVLLGSEPI